MGLRSSWSASRRATTAWASGLAGDVSDAASRSQKSTRSEKVRRTWNGSKVRSSAMAPPTLELSTIAVPGQGNKRLESVLGGPVTF